MSARSAAALLCCGALFGLSYVFVRQVAPDLGPVGVTALRTCIGGSVLWSAARVMGVRGAGLSMRYVWLGAVSAAVPWSLIALATARLNAGTSAVVNASAPVFAMVIGALAERRPPPRRGVLGMLMALSGIGVVMGSRGVAFGEGWQVGLVAGLVGAAVFAFGGFVAASRFSGVPVLAVAAGQQLGAAVILIPLAVVLAVTGVSRPHEVGPSDVALVGLLGVVGSGLAYLLFYWLIDREGPVRTATVNLVVPVAGVAWSRILLGESVGALDIAGIALTAVGVALVLRPTPLPDVP